METVAILIPLSLTYLANILIIVLGIKTIINTYRTYYMPINHESHIEVYGIVSSVKYPGQGRYTTEYVEVEFEYEGKKYKKKTRYNFAKYYKQGDAVKVCFLPDDSQMNIVIKSDESQNGILSFMAGGMCLIAGIFLAIIMTYSIITKGF